MTDFETRLRKYIQHWNSTPSSPPSILWIEALVNRVKNGQWRPEKGTSFCVDHRLVSNTRCNYEDLISDYDEFDTNIAGRDQIEKAQLSEIRHRIYKAIYWGNLFDHVLPIETRHYSLSTDRVFKIILIVISVIFFWGIITIGPSIMSGTASIDSAIRLTNKNSLSKNIDIGKITSQFLTKTAIIVKKNASLISVGEDPISSMNAIREDSYGIVQTPSIDTAPWSSSVAWQNASEDERRAAISDELFFRRILGEPNPLTSFNQNTRFIVTPDNNKAEIFTQLSMLAVIALMVNWFISKKSHYYEIARKLSFSKRIPAIQILEGTLLSYFFLRKKFHYLIAFGAAAIAVFLHYYFMSVLSHIQTYEASQVLKLHPVDYRLRSSSQPVLVIYWAAQFTIVYLFSLMAWELGALNSCMRKWQGQLAKARILSQSDFKELFGPVSSYQVGLLVTCLLLACFTLGGASLLKYWSIQPKIPWPTEFSLAALSSLNSWDTWVFAYIFSPVVLVLPLLGYAVMPCFKNANDAILNTEKTLPDIDSVLESFQETWTQLKTAEKWVNENLSVSAEADTQGATQGESEDDSTN